MIDISVYERCIRTCMLLVDAARCGGRIYCSLVDSGIRSGHGVGRLRG